MERTLAALIVALALGLVVGQVLALAAVFAWMLGPLLTAAAAGGLVGGWIALARIQPRSAIPTAVFPVAALIAAGPLGLYSLPVPVLVLTPIAVWRAVKRKHDAPPREGGSADPPSQASVR